MTSIIRAKEEHTPLLSQIAKTTFLESHGNSAEPGDVDTYVAKTYNTDILRKELQDPLNIYHILYHDDQAVGYSKIVLDCPYTNGKPANITKLERLYLLKEFYRSGLGQKLFEFIVDLIKKNGQTGIWLYVWKENQRAINFYEKNGFIIIGSHDFKISENHSNPNHLMFLGFT